jgi:transposase
MAVYSAELKEQIVRKMLPPGQSECVEDSPGNGDIGTDPVCLKKQYRERGFVVPSKSSHPNDWDARSKLATVIKTAAMNEAELAVWCRENGLYKEQLAAWKAAFESMSSEPPSSKVEMAAVLKKKPRPAKGTGSQGQGIG